jgi:hypothetical protein
MIIRQSRLVLMSLIPVVGCGRTLEDSAPGATLPAVEAPNLPSSRGPYPHHWPIEIVEASISDRTLEIQQKGHRFVVEECGSGLVSYGAKDSDDEKTGWWFDCDENHVLRRVVQYRSGWESGTCLVYDTKGRLRVRGALVYVEGRGVLRTGHWEYWLEDGSPDVAHSGEYIGNQLAEKK